MAVHDGAAGDGGVTEDLTVSGDRGVPADDGPPEHPGIAFDGGSFDDGGPAGEHGAAADGGGATEHGVFGQDRGVGDGHRAERDGLAADGCPVAHVRAGRDSIGRRDPGQVLGRHPSRIWSLGRSVVQQPGDPPVDERHGAFLRFGISTVFGSRGFGGA
ncbi:hypothetical protein [Nakamurella sp.]|uniref:hypothetical protein n=1 Tax=Nakamurella sp. TaxID=1869182 RepID=UPI003B3B1A87